MNVIIQTIEKEFGKNVIVNANSILDEDRQIIPISPRLDFITGGGIAEGTNTVLTGFPKCGKTTTALHIASNAQKEKHGNREIYYLNTESRLHKRDLEGIVELNSDKFHVVQSTVGKILNATDFLSIAQHIINDVPRSVIIIDSFSALCTESEISGGMEQMQRADGAKLLSKFFRKVSNIIPINKNILIGISHLMGNPSGFGEAAKEKGGFAIAYHCDLKLRAKWFKPWPSTGDIRFGQEVEWHCQHSSLGPPGKKTSSYIRYNTGIDIQYELLKMCLDIGIISQKGAWFYVDYNGEELKFQGGERLRQAMVDDKGLLNHLEKQYKEIME